MDKSMNRNEHRSFQHELNKNREWFRRLPDSQKRFVGYFIEQKTIENDNLVAAILDKCILSALDDNTDLDLLDQKKIISEANGYILDYKTFLDENKKDGFGMIEDQEIIKKIKATISEMITNKIDKAKGLKLLKKEFNYPNAELSDLWIKVKEEKGIHNPHTPEKYLNKDSESKKNNLKVINTVTEIKGEYDTYFKSIDGVKTNQRLFKDILEVNQYKTATAAEYTEKEKNLVEKITKLNNQLIELREKNLEENEMLEEIKQVFSF